MARKKTYQNYLDLEQQSTEKPVMSIVYEKYI